MRVVPTRQEMSTLSQTQVSWKCVAHRQPQETAGIAHHGNVQVPGGVPSFLESLPVRYAVVGKN